MKQSLYTSAYYSLFVQFIIGIICLCGIFLEIDNNDKILNEILILETIVQLRRLELLKKLNRTASVLELCIPQKCV